jgi:hypothetical protein
MDGPVLHPTSLLYKFGFLRTLLFVSFYKLLELQYLYGLQLTITMLVCNSFRWIALFCIQPHCSANLGSCGFFVFVSFYELLGVNMLALRNPT